jgi:hypothetical protein
VQSFQYPLRPQHSPPACILRSSHRIANVDTQRLMQDSSDEDSILDDHPYNIMRNRQPGDPPLRDLLAAYFKKHPEKLNNPNLPQCSSRMDFDPEDLLTQDDRRIRPAPARVSLEFPSIISSKEQPEDAEEFEWDG